MLEAVGGKFSHRPGNPATVGVVRWPSAGDTAGYRLGRPKLTPVSLISNLDGLKSVRAEDLIFSRHIVAVQYYCNKNSKKNN